jgi:hypothetical protein
MPVLTTPIGVLLTLQLAAAPPAPPPPPTASPDPTPSSEGASSDLAAEAPVPDWVPEGGSSAHKTDVDPHEVNRKVRNAARTTIAGGGIALVGIAVGVSGLLMYMIPKQQLTKLTDDTGHYKPGDAKRQSAIATMQAAPYVGYAGVGLVAVGILTAVIAGARFKKLRENKRTSMAFGPMHMFKGGGLSAEVRF